MMIEFEDGKYSAIIIYRIPYYYGRGVIIKEYLEPKIPAAYWANKDLLYKDQMNGMSSKEIMKNVKRGKYIMIDNPSKHKQRQG